MAGYVGFITQLLITFFKANTKKIKIQDKKGEIQQKPKQIKVQECRRNKANMQPLFWVHGFVYSFCCCCWCIFFLLFFFFGLMVCSIAFNTVGHNCNGVRGLPPACHQHHQRGLTCLSELATTFQFYCTCWRERTTL